MVRFILLGETTSLLGCFTGRPTRYRIAMNAAERTNRENAVHSADPSVDWDRGRGWLERKDARLVLSILLCRKHARGTQHCNGLGANQFIHLVVRRIPHFPNDLVRPVRDHRHT